MARYGNELVTPDPVIGTLFGTTQRELFAYGPRRGMTTRYEKLSIARLKEADEVYQTRGGWIIPVSEVLQ